MIMRWSYENTKVKQKHKGITKDKVQNLKVITRYFQDSIRISQFTTIGIAGTSGLAIILLGLFILPVFSSTTPTHAASDDPTISITPISGINLNMTPAAGNNGSFGTATADVTVTTTGTAGYTFTMNTQTTNTDLTSSRVDYSDPTKADLKITNITASTTQANFSPNKWGYNVNKNGTYIKGAANTYIPVPNSGSSDPDRQIEITDAAGSNTYTFTYGVQANNNLPAGEYATTLVFSVTANTLPAADCSTVTCNIVYNNNGSTSANGISATHAGVHLNDSIDLYPGNDYKTNHGFAGWSTDPEAGLKIASSDAAVRSSVKVYGPMETVTVDQDLLDENQDGTITLYAVWVAAPTTSGVPLTMQDFDTTTCSNLAETTYDSTTQTITPGQITARKDSRDNNTYAIARLADGNCWMMENLRLDSSASLDATNTHNPAGGFTNLPASSNNWCNASTEECYNTAQFCNSNTTATISPMTTKNQNIYGYGNYYSWRSVTAGRGTYSTTSGDVPGDICPYNWTLPTSGSASQQFGTLSKAYGGSGGNQFNLALNQRFRTYPNNFLFSGNVNSSVVNLGSDGFWWSKSARSAPYAYNLGLGGPGYAGYVGPSIVTSHKWNGFPARCLIPNV